MRWVSHRAEDKTLFPKAQELRAAGERKQFGPGKAGPESPTRTAMARLLVQAFSGEVAEKPDSALGNRLIGTMIASD